MIVMPCQFRVQCCPFSTRRHTKPKEMPTSSIFIFRLSASICLLGFLVNIYKNLCNIECFHLYNFYVFFFLVCIFAKQKKIAKVFIQNLESFDVFSIVFLWFSFHFPSLRGTTTTTRKKKRHSYK